MATLNVTCGVLILNTQSEIFLCHSTGTPRWDIPKGMADPGEAERDAAVREALEEAGLTLNAADLLDLGRHRYLRTKDLHLFGLLMPRFDTAVCNCTSFFENSHGRQQPETDAWQWVAFREVPVRCGNTLARLLESEVRLGDVLERLQTT